jgi:hypothetical protein
MALRLLLSVSLLSFTLSACQTFGNARVMYDQDGIQIDLQPDFSVQRTSPPTLNAHPSTLTTQELLVLLGALRVSGWSGTIVGWLDAPRSIPLFDEADLRAIASPIAEAFRQVRPTERVFFTLPNPKSAYGDATTGALFLRGSYLHVVVTDHKAFARADSAGGDEKDVRDTKGMKLSVARPYRAVTLPALDEPDWPPFESVHLSLNVKELLAQDSVKSGGMVKTNTPEPALAGKAPVIAAEPTETPQDLRLQIRELTQSNLDLRDRLNQQARQLQELTDELTKIRREADSARTKKPATRKPSTP